MKTGIADIDNIIREQGWDDRSLLSLLINFVEDKELQVELLGYLEGAQDAENEATEEMDIEPMWCSECGEEAFFTPRGVAHHGEPDGIDYERDGEHVALPQPEEE